MKLYLAHNDQKLEVALKKFILEEMPDVKLYAYDESYTDEKQKAARIRGAFSAGMSPFAVLKTDEDKYIKAFYSEVNECTLDCITHNLLYYHGSKSH